MASSSISHFALPKTQNLHLNPPPHPPPSLHSRRTRRRGRHRPLCRSRGKLSHNLNLTPLIRRRRLPRQQPLNSLQSAHLLPQSHLPIKSTNPPLLSAG